MLPAPTRCLGPNLTASRVTFKKTLCILAAVLTRDPGSVALKTTKIVTSTIESCGHGLRLAAARSQTLYSSETPVLSQSVRVAESAVWDNPAGARRCASTAARLPGSDRPRSPRDPRPRFLTPPPVDSPSRVPDTELLPSPGPISSSEMGAGMASLPGAPAGAAQAVGGLGTTCLLGSILPARPLARRAHPAQGSSSVKLPLTLPPSPDFQQLPPDNPLHSAGGQEGGHGSTVTLFLSHGVCKTHTDTWARENQGRAFAQQMFGSQLRAWGSVLTVTAALHSPQVPVGRRDRWPRK